MNVERLRGVLLVLTLSATIAVADAGSGAHAQAMPDDLKAIAPAAGDYSDRFVIGRLWAGKSLTRRDRSIVTLAAIVATGQSAAMPQQFAQALDDGVSPAEMSELLLHLAMYTGLPNANASAIVVRKVFRERGISDDALAPASSRLLPLDDNAEEKRVERIAKSLGPAFQELQDYTTDLLFRDLWLRPSLSPRDRSLVTISALVATGRSAQLASHINLGLDNGLTQAEIAGAITHLAFYSGWPNAMSAASVAHDIFAKRDP